MEVHNESTSVKGKVRVSFADVKPAMPNRVMQQSPGLEMEMEEELKAILLEEVCQEVHLHRVRRTQILPKIEEKQHRAEQELSEEETRSDALRAETQVVPRVSDELHGSYQQ